MTIIVKVLAVPKQVNPLAENSGVTVIVATTGAVPVFMAAKAAILPTPLAARPMLVLLFVQR